LEHDISVVLRAYGLILNVIENFVYFFLLKEHSLL